MKIGIICASDEELAPFLSDIEDCAVIKKAKLEFYIGRIAGVDAVALFSGVCKVNAAIAAQILIDTFKVDAVINAGTAGGMSPDVRILDTVISTEMVYHDVAGDILTEFHPWMKTEYFYANEALVKLSESAVRKLKLNYKVYWGRMATGESFIDTEGRKEINNKFAPFCVDMETAAVAHVCYAFDIPFISIRSITDDEEHSGADNFEKNCQAAAVIAKDITLALINEMKNSTAETIRQLEER